VRPACGCNCLGWTKQLNKTAEQNLLTKKQADHEPGMKQKPVAMVFQP
jgi:hypothetical protein